MIPLPSAADVLMWLAQSSFTNEIDLSIKKLYSLADDYYKLRSLVYKPLDELIPPYKARILSKFYVFAAVTNKYVFIFYAVTCNKYNFTHRDMRKLHHSNTSERSMVPIMTSRAAARALMYWQETLEMEILLSW